MNTPLPTHEVIIRTKSANRLVLKALAMSKDEAMAISFAVLRANPHRFQSDVRSIAIIHNPRH